MSLGFLTALLVAGRPARATDKTIDLNADGTKESIVSTSVVTTYPVQIKNKITNKAVGRAFRFNWPSAGPGGFFSEAGTSTKPGTSTGVGAIWTWQTTQQVFSFTGNQCSNDICFTQTFPTGRTGSIGPFGAPGRSLTSNGVTVTNESLTASLLTFFSPEVELFHVTSSVEQLASGLFRYKTTFTNDGTDEIVVEQPPAPLGCDSFCGDGHAEGVEDCDGSDLRGRTCDSYGMAGDGLACTSQCTVDLSGCVAAQCGNGTKEGYESCDGEDFGDYSCSYFGGTGGSLGCDKGCNLDFSGCEGICGNGTADGSEECDGADLAGRTCSYYGGGKGVGGTLGCNYDCTYDVSGCTGVCGNGIQEYYNGEDCDGSDLAGTTCGDLYSGKLTGPLSCQNDCTFDSSECTCGDGNVSGWEECDGDNLNDYTCADFGGTGGTLGCSGCYYDLSQCTGLCGNGVREGDEQCDGESIGKVSCEDFGGSGGTVGCSYNCTYDLKNCNDVCGNGVVDEGEDCDGSDLNGWDCSGPGSKRAPALRSSPPDKTLLKPGIAQDSAAVSNRALSTPQRKVFRIGPDGKRGLSPAAPTARSGSGTNTVVAPQFLGGKNILQCDSTCHFDRSDCLVPCSTPGSTHTIPGGASTETCAIATHPAKEVTGQITVCGLGIPDGDPSCDGNDPGTRGTANQLVPDESITITGPYLVASRVEVVDGADNLAEPGETVQLFVYLSNVGPGGLTGVHAHLTPVADDVDGDGTPDAITVVQGDSDYPDGPCMSGLPGGSGDCRTPAGSIPSCANITPFVITLPAGHPIDVSRTFTLSITGDQAANVDEASRTLGTNQIFQVAGFTIGVVGPVCGDGLLQPLEQCDDGNTVSGDCCSSTCQLETGSCSDGNVCTLNDTCQSGHCVSGSLNSCNDNNPCTDDACSSSAPSDGCTHTNNTNPCNLCAVSDFSGACLSTGSGICSGGVCVPATRACPVAIVEADTMVKKSSATYNFGKKDELEADNPSSDIHTLVRIRVAGTAGQTIQNAALQLFAKSSSSSGGRIHKAACNWSETGVTWRTQPAFTSTPIDTKGAIVKNTPVSFDLSSALQGEGDGTYCFLIDNVLGDADYYSREASVGRPSVTLNTTASCVPVATQINADATVVSTTPTTNFGSNTLLSVDASPIKQVFFRVSVTGVGSRSVTSARLRLMISNVSGSDADKGGTIRQVPASQCLGWNESTITYATRPTGAGSSLSSVSTVKAGQLVEFDLKSTIPGDGTYCYRLESSSTNGADYNSKEGAALRPQLVLTVSP